MLASALVLKLQYINKILSIFLSPLNREPRISEMENNEIQGNEEKF